ncbi:DUF3794 and LysM peptidoglycan-binding domain-containing protein [Alkaliphilus oremlandii]|uniref:Peptidoglycan-binding LysM n=1 Tax=Alkaliphilus oremlandii (strain OhILAs) TaxID=350688 RepID=A8ML30_ALKOO|nr:SPOCS domain-containing protein [Alkaliphilus oremlandii]ABW17847.1 Peptidoglycan-binding LysM [Alkaliphilus oremlandii OhILAs]
MSVELIKDVLKLEQVIGENIAQTIVEGDILVPDTKPDITRVLSATGKVQLTKQEIGENKITAEGVTYFKILYVSEKGDQPLYSIDSSTEFKQSIDIDGVTPQMKGEVTAEVEHIDFTINNDRKIGIKAIINLASKVIEEKSIEITKDIAGIEDIQVLKESFQYTDTAGYSKSEALIKDGFEMMEEEYEIKEVLKWDLAVIERESKITDGKVIVGGVANIEFLYIDDDYDNPLKVIKREVPFTHFVEIPNIFGDMTYHLKLTPKELYYDIKENIRGERKIVEIESIIQADVKVMDTQSKEFLVDTYSPSQNLQISKKQMVLRESIGMSRSNVLLRETMDTPYGQPPISEVFSVNIRPILTDYTALENKMAIEGILEATVLYKAIEGAQSLYSFMQEIPFRYHGDLYGLNEDMEAEVDLFVEEITYNVINGEQVDVKVSIAALCKGYCNKSIDIISEIDVLEEDTNSLKQPSLTVYFMKDGDTLWNVAKRYHTTVQQIMETNQIEDPAAVKVGENIIIEKVHNFKL